MLTTLLLATVSALPPVETSPREAGTQVMAGTSGTSGDSALVPQDDWSDDYKKRRKAAGDDVKALWELYEYCDAYGHDKESKSCLRRIVKLDENHRKAREALGHIKFDGKWFKTEKLVEQYKKENEERIAKEKGLVKYDGEWTPEADVPYLERGMVRDADGNWVSSEEQERLEAGWTRQDLIWVSPDEKANVAAGKWKCGEDWLELKEADEYHKKLGRFWVIPSDHFVTHSTCSREVALRAIGSMEQTFRNLARIFGRSPDRPINVVVLRSADQYGAFAAGDQDAERRPAEGSGLSSVHHAFFADTWFGEEFEFMSAGVAYWDASSDAGNSFGPFAVRHAAGHSYVDAVDPSTKAVEALRKSQGQLEGYVDSFWEEKQVPMWFRYGAASFVERYYVDNLVAQGGDPLWARNWALQNLRSRGGLQPLEKIFEFGVTPDDPKTSEMLISQAGFLVAFILDGKCPPVIEKHQAVKQALREGKGGEKAFEALMKVLAKHETEMRKFGDI
jgi:hypothetical protein